MPNVIAQSLGFIRKVVANEATKKGLASAAAGLVVAVISEAIWPSP